MKIKIGKKLVDAAYIPFGVGADLELCHYCMQMTKIIDGRCAKCKERKTLNFSTSFKNEKQKIANNCHCACHDRGDYQHDALCCSVPNMKNTGKAGTKLKHQESWQKSDYWKRLKRQGKKVGASEDHIVIVDLRELKKFIEGIV